MTALTVLSPHLDDGVLSCGGQIWMARQAGAPVRVITLFAGPPPEVVPPFARVQHRMWGDPPDATRLRRGEDGAACARLGCLDLLHLDFPDAVYRCAAGGEPLYGSEQAIFGALSPTEQALATQIADEVAPRCEPASLLLAPLGVGGHVDHQVGRAVGEALRARGQRVAFYEELPYVERGATAEIEAVAAAGWQMEAVALPEEALAAKVAAMGYYRSQIPVLYGDDLSMSRRLRATAHRAAGGHGYAERRWWPPAQEA